MIIEVAKPVHSLADSRRFAEAMESLECTVVIDVAMSETARHADYVLPAANQYEKAEATFFNFEMPSSYFHLRPAIVEPPPGSDVLTEAEIHCRLVEALGAMPPELNDLAAALQQQCSICHNIPWRHTAQSSLDEVGRGGLAPHFGAAIAGTPWHKVVPVAIERIP